MRLTMKQRQAVTAVTVQRYAKAVRKLSNRYSMSSVRPLVTVVVMRVLCCVIMAGKCGCTGKEW